MKIKYLLLLSLFLFTLAPLGMSVSPHVPLPQEHANTSSTIICLNTTHQFLQTVSYWDEGDTHFANETRGCYYGCEDSTGRCREPEGVMMLFNDLTTINIAIMLLFLVLFIAVPKEHGFLKIIFMTSSLGWGIIVLGLQGIFTQFMHPPLAVNMSEYVIPFFGVYLSLFLTVMLYFFISYLFTILRTYWGGKNAK